MEIETVTIFRNWIELASSLKSDAERGKLYHAICLYSMYGIEPKLEGLLATYFNLMRPIANKSKSRKLAQKESYEKWKQNRNRTAPQNDPQNVPQNDPQTVPQTDPQNEPHNDTFADKIGEPLKKKEKENIKKTGSKEPAKESTLSFVGLLPLHLQTDEFRKTWQDWEQYRRAKRKPISLRAFKEQLKILSDLPEAQAKRSIEQSIANDWQGLFPPKASRFNGQITRDYTGI